MKIHGELRGEAQAPSGTARPLPFLKIADAGGGAQPRSIFPIVGVGASAGGLEAFSDFLKHLPPDTGMGFVLIQAAVPLDFADGAVAGPCLSSLSEPGPRAGEAAAFRKTLLLLHDHTGVDFSFYEPATFLRRIHRRMVLNRQRTLKNYARFLQGNVPELDALYSDALINVTAFFRDPEAFDALKHLVFPKLLQQRGDSPLRVWVLGCSTGQEAYSIAMADLEFAEGRGSTGKLHVFATDLEPDGFLFFGSSESAGVLDEVFAPVDKKHRIYSRKTASTPKRLEPVRTRVDGNAAWQSQVRRIADLERDLAESRNYLREIQQHEAAIEELQVSNKELQSLNEELETSKEELEATNQEVLTTNEQIISRNVELGRLSSDLLNLQNSIRMPILLLGLDHRIRTFSAMAEQVLNLKSTDIGQPFSSVLSNLNIAALEPILDHAIAGLEESEREVQTADGRWYVLRVRPYFTIDSKADGVVLLLVDIDALKRSQLAIEEAKEQAEAIIRTVPEPILILDAGLRLQAANDAFYRTFKVSFMEAENRLIFELNRNSWNIPRLRELLEDIIPRNSYFNDFELTHTFEGIGRRTLLLNARKLNDSSGRAKQIFLGIRDVTEVLAFQTEVRLSELRYRRLFEATSSGVLLVDPSTRRILLANPFASAMLGGTPQELRGKELCEVGLFKENPEIDTFFRQLSSQGHVQYQSWPLMTGGAGRDVELSGTRYTEDDHEVILCIVRETAYAKRSEGHC